MREKPLSHQEYLFKDCPNQELIELYQTLHDDENTKGIFSTYGKLLSDNANLVYQELKKRNLEIYCAFYHLRENLENMSVEDLDKLITTIESETIGGDGIFKEEFTEVGDPISDISSVIWDIVWMLKAQEEVSKKQSALHEA